MPVRMLAELLQQARDDALGHTPDDGIIELVGRNQTALAGDIEPNRMVGGRVEEMVDGNPAGCGHFGIGGQRRPCRGQEYKWPDGDGWKDGGSRHDVIQSADQLLSFEVDTHLLRRLADDSGQEVLVLGLAAPAG
jgi:hypothetical protein